MMTPTAFQFPAEGPKALPDCLRCGIAWLEEVTTMAGLSRREPRGEPTDIFGRLDRMFEEWHHGMLHLEAERREEERPEEKDHVRRELRYGALSRPLPLPAGVTCLGLRLPMP
jgi:hypothetical protein